MPQVELANTQCSLLADMCDDYATVATDASKKVELEGLCDVLRKANGTFTPRPAGPPLTGWVQPKQERQQ